VPGFGTTWRRKSSAFMRMPSIGTDSIDYVPLWDDHSRAKGDEIPSIHMGHGRAGTMGDMVTKGCRSRSRQISSGL
jgi:hypothetical protein